MDSFTSALRKRTDCSYCDAAICRACLQQCLLMDTATEPACPSCRAAWSRSFLNEQLTAAFRNNAFKLHREKVLVDRERARFPETQENAAAYKNALEALKDIDESIDVLKKQISALPSYKVMEDKKKVYLDSRKGRTYADWVNDPSFRPIYDEYAKACTEYRKAKLAIARKIKILNKGTRDNRYTKSTYGLILVPYVRPNGAAAAAVAVAAPVPPPEPKAIFVQKCPSSTCEGFLSTQWNCGLCKLKVCKDCHEPKNDDHVCDPELVESIKAIRKEAKPCPKCASLISKIDGCDQMWCTQCKTAFSWTSGKIETHVIHNPHYFQWMRENGGLPRAPGDVPFNPCGGPAALTARLNTLRKEENSTIVDRLLNYIRLFRHIQYVEIPHFRRTIDINERDEWRRQLRVQRMVNEITEKDWKTTLQRKEKETLKMRDRIQLAEMYINAGNDIVGQIMTNDNVQAVYDQMKTLYEFTEKASQKMASTYNCVPLDIDPSQRVPQNYWA